MPGAVTIATFLTHGGVCGALPSGRKAGEPLANGAAATLGAESGGLLANINSQGKIDYVNNPAVIWNVRLDGGTCDTPEGRKDFADFVRVFVDKKIAQMQVMSLSTETMRKAQQEPEKYRDLLVRVVGYSANFVNLPETVQNHVIEREEHPINS